MCKITRRPKYWLGDQKNPSGWSVGRCKTFPSNDIWHHQQKWFLRNAHSALPQWTTQYWLDHTSFHWWSAGRPKVIAYFAHCFIQLTTNCRRWKKTVYNQKNQAKFIVRSMFCLPWLNITDNVKHCSTLHRIGRLESSHILSRGPPTGCHHCGQTLTIDHMPLECALLQECRDEYYTVDSLNTLFETIPESCIVEFLREAGFFYLIWCNLLTSTSPQTCTIWSDLSNYLENESNSETHLLV